MTPREIWAALEAALARAIAAETAAARLHESAARARAWGGHDEDESLTRAAERAERDYDEAVGQVMAALLRLQAGGHLPTATPKGEAA